MKPIYLDNNATTPVLPEVVAAMQPFWTDTFGNPSSRHAAGRRARRALEDAREQVASLLGADADEVVFTSGGTEANDLAIAGLARIAGTTGPDRYAATTSIEHPSVSGCFEALVSDGWHVHRLPVSRDGIVDPDDVEAWIEQCRAANAQTRHSALLASCMLANNETGAVQPVAELAELGRPQHIALHTDAVQAVGKIPVNFRDLGVATLALAAHKFHGPKGIGALLVRRGLDLPPVFPGGHQQSGLRPGTEPVALVVGMAKALEQACADLAARGAFLQRLRDRLHAGLQRSIPDVVLNGPSDARRLPNTLNVSFPGVDAQALLMGLDLEGVCCSVGSACASGSTRPSPVLEAMGIPAAVLKSAVRFSVGALNTEHEIDQAVARIAHTLARMQPIISA